MDESWHLARDGELVGVFPGEEIIEGLGSGRFATDDLVWRAGLEEWRPVGSVAELVKPALAAARAVIEDGPPWEWRARLGWGPALFRTVLGVLDSPSRTFSGMRPGGSIRGSILFLVLLGWPTALLSSMLFERLDLSLLRDSGFVPPEVTAFLVGESMLVAFSVLAAPFVLVLGQLVGASLVHGSLLLVGAAPQPWSTTFRVSCYVAGSTSPLQLVPGVGWVVAWIWSGVATVIGLSRAHGVTVRAVLFGLSVPPLVILTLLASFVIGRFVL